MATDVETIRVESTVANTQTQVLRVGLTDNALIQANSFPIFLPLFWIFDIKEE